MSGMSAIGGVSDPEVDMTGEQIIGLVALPFISVTWLKGLRVPATAAAGSLVVLVLGLLGLAGLLLLPVVATLAFGPPFTQARPGSFWWQKVYSEAKRHRLTNRPPLTTNQRWLVGVGAFVMITTGFGLMLGVIGSGFGHQEQAATRFGIALIVWVAAGAAAFGLYRSRPWAFLAAPLVPLLLLVASGAASSTTQRESVSESATGPAHFLAFASPSFAQLDLLALDARGNTIAVVESPLGFDFSMCPGGRRVVQLGQAFTVIDLATLDEVASYPGLSDEFDGSVSFRCLSPEGDRILAVRGSVTYPEEDGYEVAGGPMNVEGQVFITGTEPSLVAEGAWDRQDPGALSETHALLIAGAPHEPSPSFPKKVLLVDIETGSISEIADWLIYERFYLDPQGRWAVGEAGGGGGQVLQLLDLANPSAPARPLPGVFGEPPRWSDVALVLVSANGASYVVTVVEPETSTVTTIDGWPVNNAFLHSGNFYGLGDSGDVSVLFRRGFGEADPVVEMRSFDTSHVLDLIVLPEPLNIEWPSGSDE